MIKKAQQQTVLWRIVFCVLLVTCIFLQTACSSGEATRSLSTAFDTEVTEPALPQDMRVRRVSFAAVGDNLIHSSVYGYARQSDGSYNFDMMYEHIASRIQEVDVAYINQETVCGGTEMGLSAYPVFNSPQEVLDAVKNAGFDWVGTASNHSLDAYPEGIIKQLDKIEQLGLVQTGTDRSFENDETPTVIEVNGVRVGLAAYTYGLNGFVLPSGQEYLIDLIDREQIAADYAALSAVSDVQLVSMHWGVEYQHSPNEEQVSLAQFLADLGYDVVIGAHPHVVQPTTMLTGSGGNKTLVVYSLGNFISAQDQPERMLGEMARWTLCFDPFTKEVLFEDVEIWPIVTHMTDGWTGHEVYALADYTDELASRHMWRGKGLTREYLVNLANEVFGDEFPVRV